MAKLWLREKNLIDGTSRRYGGNKQKKEMKREVTKWHSDGHQFKDIMHMGPISQDNESCWLAFIDRRHWNPDLNKSQRGLQLNMPSYPAANGENGNWFGRHVCMRCWVTFASELICVRHAQVCEEGTSMFHSWKRHREVRNNYYTKEKTTILVRICWIFVRSP